MTKDEIMQAQRLTAMGRSGHPLQEQLADWLLEMDARLARLAPLPVVEMPAPVEIALVGEAAEPSEATIDAEVTELRRTRRAKKAE